MQIVIAHAVVPNAERVVVLRLAANNLRWRRKNLIESIQTRCMIMGYNDISYISSYFARVAAHPGFLF
jgi:hypothetical protein